MKILIVTTLLFLTLSTPVSADKDQLKYNAIEGEWSYEKPNSQLQYNPFEGKFEYVE